ncbi:unnamed protein product [Lactuca saligna]|uniref:Uncharacterized protein n=1 Tax=Lactuca saligna TaxID=75948 RepID=A0AA35ZPT9_LACSI|nr:unnamed protein product [Lactuca saligna]
MFPLMAPLQNVLPNMGPPLSGLQQAWMPPQPSHPLAMPPYGSSMPSDKVIDAHWRTNLALTSRRKVEILPTMSSKLPFSSVVATPGMDTLWREHSTMDEHQLPNPSVLN